MLRIFLLRSIISFMLILLGVIGFGTNLRDSGTRNAATHYHTLSTEDISRLPVKDIASKNCVLFLWVTNPLIPEGLDVIKSWGFEYKTIGFVWVKQSPTYSVGKLDCISSYNGLGYYTRGGAEMCLIGMKGLLERKDHTIRQVQSAQVRNHSQKPMKIRDLIVRLFGDLPRVELFARQKATGWDSWGDEVEEYPTLLNYY